MATTVFKTDKFLRQLLHQTTFTKKQLGFVCFNSCMIANHSYFDSS